jgi:hypothetical protein
VTEEKVVTQIKEAAVSTGLVINKSKTKYVQINRNVTNLEQDLIINRQIFEGVQNFTYLGAMINSKNLVSDEIKSRIAGGNTCFYSLRQIFRSRAMTKAVKIKMCKTILCAHLCVHACFFWGGVICILYSKFFLTLTEVFFRAFSSVVRQMPG